VHDEHSAQVRYSLDVFIADLLHLTTDDARHVLQKIAAPLGLWVLRAPGTGEESNA
jgi:hypothetical protein